MGNDSDGNSKPEIVRDDRSSPLVEQPGLLSKVTRFWWRNLWDKKARQSYEELVRADRSLKEEFVRHAQTAQKVEDLPIILATDRLERINEYDDAKRKAELSELSDAIAREERELKLEELRRQRERIKRVERIKDEYEVRRAEMRLDELDREEQERRRTPIDRTQAMEEEARENLRAYAAENMSDDQAIVREFSEFCRKNDSEEDRARYRDILEAWREQRIREREGY